jgi:hypothetical protein
MTYTWTDEAACVGADTDRVFFPPGPSPDYRDAKTFCADCPIRNACADLALKHEAGQPLGMRFGYQGGLTPEQRLRLDPAGPRTVRVSLSEHSRTIRRGLYEEGLSDSEIADRTGTTTIAIRHWRNRANLPANDLKDQADRERLYAQGMTDSEIARELGQRRNAVFHWRHQRGLPANKVAVS